MKQQSNPSSFIVNNYTKQEIEAKDYITYTELKEILNEKLGKTEIILKSVLRGD